MLSNSFKYGFVYISTSSSVRWCVLAQYPIAHNDNPANHIQDTVVYFYIPILIAVVFRTYQHEQGTTISPCCITQISASHIEACLAAAVSKSIAMKFIPDLLCIFGFLVIRQYILRHLAHGILCPLRFENLNLVSLL